MRELTCKLGYDEITDADSLPIMSTIMRDSTCNSSPCCHTFHISDFRQLASRTSDLCQVFIECVVRQVPFSFHNSHKFYWVSVALKNQNLQLLSPISTSLEVECAGTWHWLMVLIKVPANSFHIQRDNKLNNICLLVSALIHLWKPNWTFIVPNVSSINNKK